MQNTFDLIVLGGGPAGYVGAIRAAQLGARVALVERERVGGTCLNWGCIPTKALVESARLYEQRKQMASFGLLVKDVGFDLGIALERKDGIVTNLVRGLESMLKSYNITTFTGDGQAIDAHTVVVSGQKLSAPRLLIATGSTATVPPIPGANGPAVLTNKEILAISPQPKRLAIIGGGVIGVEFAGIFAAIGTEVTILEALPRILPSADEETAAFMASTLQALGVRIETGVKVQSIAGAAGDKQVHLPDRMIDVDAVLMATGRAPALNGLEHLHLAMGRNGITTNEYMETSIPGVAAAGDVVAGRPMLAHVAFHEAKVAVENLLGERVRMDYSAVPQCVFGPLDLAQVGLTEQEAREQGYNVKVGRFPLAALGRAYTLGETRGFVKVISEEQHGALLGVHMIGPHASELLGEATLGVQLETTLDEIVQTMHMHPTLGEGLLEAALDASTGALHLPRRKEAR